MDLSTTDRQALAAAMRGLEQPSLAGRLAALAGKPVGLVQGALPALASRTVARLTKRALERALDVALFSLANRRVGGGRKLHSGLACASGAIGGAFGLAALAVELPVSTTIMLRAIAAIAREEGEDLVDPRTGLACLEVLALGGPSADDSGTETDYFAVRAMLARGLVEVADFTIEKSAIREGAPLFVRFTSQIASRFGVVVSQKLAAQAVAVIGALGGAAINLAFIEHFQDVARGHFTVRRLERIYGAELVRAEYERLKSDLAGAALPHITSAKVRIAAQSGAG
jgi:EcsC protein family